MGRPKKDEFSKKSVTVNIRMTPSEHELFKEYARSQGISLPQLIKNTSFLTLELSAKRRLELQREMDRNENY